MVRKSLFLLSVILAVFAGLLICIPGDINSAEGGGGYDYDIEEEIYEEDYSSENPKQDYVPGRIIVKFKKPQIATAGLSATEQVRIKKMNCLIRWKT